MIFENSYWIGKWVCQGKRHCPVEGEPGVGFPAGWGTAGRKGHQSRGLSGDWLRNLPWGGMQRSGTPPGWSDHCGVSTRQGKVLLSSSTNWDQLGGKPSGVSREPTNIGWVVWGWEWGQGLLFFAALFAESTVMAHSRCSVNVYEMN